MRAIATQDHRPELAGKDDEDFTDVAGRRYAKGALEVAVAGAQRRGAPGACLHVVVKYVGSWSQIAFKGRLCFAAIRKHGYELRRTPLLRGWVNKDRRKGRSLRSSPGPKKERALAFLVATCARIRT